MSHPQQQDFIRRIKQHFPAHFSKQRVLEIGSLDINGSVRSAFDQCDYIGLDVAPGPGVDVVCQGQAYDAPDASFDTVISCEVMEHNPFWRETFLNMARLTRPGGLVLMTCATRGRAEHGTARSVPGASPLTVQMGWNYYHNLVARDFKNGVLIGSLFSDCMFCTDFGFFDLYFAGFRAGSPPPQAARQILHEIRRTYWLRNMTRPAALRRRGLIALVGEERYFAGPIRLWAKS